MTYRSMITRSSIATVVAIAALWGGASTVHAEDTPEPSAAGCPVAGGTLDWGIKESFRAYVSGTIANGEWTTSEGATYATPSFHWENPSGSLNPKTGEGSAAFTGQVNFTGHDGILDMTLGNPTVRFGADGAVTLHADASSNDMSGTEAINEKQVELAKFETAGPLDPAIGAVTLTALPGVLTEAGAPAFGDFYLPGDAMDPLTLTLAIGECVADGAADSETTSAESTGATDDASNGVAENDTAPILWLIGGMSALVLIIAVATGLLVAHHKRGRARAQD